MNPSKILSRMDVVLPWACFSCPLDRLSRSAITLANTPVNPTTTTRSQFAGPIAANEPAV